ncbi:ligand-regulated transcription factor [Cryptococcus deuterogattii MMRL2647]|nr:ligand-regulated transcription factor [Cryptococcus deuterogattii MMRL2647]
MVLINDKKFACEKCIKGHRVSACTHTDRPLFEVKKKGRPSTQCKHCKEKRKTAGSSVHTKCQCGASDSKTLKDILASVNAAHASANASAGASAAANTSVEPEFETRKGQPGSKPTFPRGLKDVHELAAAANGLQGLREDDQAVRAAERTVQALLNPCKCELGGPCTCCQIKTKPRKKHSGHELENAASVGATPPGGGCCGSSVVSRDDVATRHSPTSINSSETVHHPPQTAPMLHKTRLFSPYSTDLRRRDSSSSTGSRTPGWASPRAVRPPPTRIRPLTDMRRLMSAALNQDGTLASEIPRSVVGLPTLPGIESFDTSANVENGEKSEDVDMPLAFPTSEDVVIGACVQSIAQLICIAASQVPPPPPNRTDSLNPHDTRILPPSASLSDDAARTMGIVPLKPLECCGGLIMPQGSRPPSALGRSGSMSAAKRSGTSNGVRRSNSDVRKAVGPSQPHHLQSIQSPSDRPFYIGAPQPTQIAPNGVSMASAAPSQMTVSLNNADANSDLLAFFQQQWSAGKTSNSDMNPSEPAMPNSAAEPWAFLSQNEATKDSSPSESFDLDAFLMSIGVQPDGEIRNDKLSPSQPPQSHMTNIPSTQSIAPLPSLPLSTNNVRPGYDMTFANFFLNSAPSGPSGPSAIPTVNIPSHHATPHASRPPTPPEASFGECPRRKFSGVLGSEMPMWKGPEALDGFGVLGSPVLEKEEVGEEEENGKDIIDLSKPLDSAALTKIMKALEKQGGQSSSQGAPSVVNSGQPFQPLPALQTALPAHPAAVISPRGADPAHELDDMFSQFVTLDGTPIGGNNDGLGLNGGSGMMGLPTNMSLGEELGFGAEMRWDQARMWSN